MMQLLEYIFQYVIVMKSNINLERNIYIINDAQHTVISLHTTRNVFRQKCLFLQYHVRLLGSNLWGPNLHLCFLNCFLHLCARCTVFFGRVSMI